MDISNAKEEPALVQKENTFKVDVKTFGSVPGGLCKITDTVSANYQGKFLDGKVFDENKFGMPFKFVLGQQEVIKCWDMAFAQMTIGEKAQITCPSDIAYGDEGSGPIPGKATLLFDVEVLNCEQTFWLVYYYFI